VAGVERYFSRAFIDAFVVALRRDVKFQSATRKFKNAIELRVLDMPDGEDLRVRYHVDRGMVTADVTTGRSPSAAIREAPFDKGALLIRATALYTTWTKLDRGDISVVGALRSPDFRVEGGVLSAAARAAALTAMNAVAQKMPKTY
jgi:hypothetical protein